MLIEIEIQKQEARRRADLKTAIAAFPPEERADRIADALEEIAESERRARLMKQVEKMPTDEIERRLG
jgi:hypothetical protein